jgi:hypothetical protein
MKRLEPDLPKGEYPDCTSSWTNPIIDMGVAVITGSAAVLLHSAASSEENDGDDPGTFRAAGWGAIGVAAVFIGSGAYGTYQRNRCRNAVIDAERAAPEPTFLDVNKPLKGSPGASCKDDSDCGEDLLCGEPMKTCIPANPPEESPSP